MGFGAPLWREYCKNGQRSQRVADAIVCITCSFFFFCGLFCTILVF